MDLLCIYRNNDQVSSLSLQLPVRHISGPAILPAPCQPGGPHTLFRRFAQRNALVRNSAELSHQVLNGREGGSAHEHLAA